MLHESESSCGWEGTVFAGQAASQLSCIESPNEFPKNRRAHPVSPSIYEATPIAEQGSERHFACFSAIAGTSYHADHAGQGKILVCPIDSRYLSNGQTFPDCFAATHSGA